MTAACAAMHEDLSNEGHTDSDQKMQTFLCPGLSPALQRQQTPHWRPGTKCAPCTLDLVPFLQQNRILIMGNVGTSL